MKKTWQQKLMMVKCQIFKKTDLLFLAITHMFRDSKIYFLNEILSYLPNFFWPGDNKQGYFGGHRDKILKR